MSLHSTTAARNPSPTDRRGASRVGICIALSLYAGFCLYCLLAVFFGPAGLEAYRRLEERKSAMQANLGDLAAIRESLNSDLDSLKSDPDRAAREARSLGYLRKGETALILGTRIEKPSETSPGKVLAYAEPSAMSDIQAKEIALGGCLAIMALLLAPRKSEKRRDRADTRAASSPALHIYR